MKDIILCFKLIKYGLQFKLMCILGAAFFGLGILFEVQGTGTTNLGGIYMSLAGLYVFQLTFTPSIAKLVQTSPYKKKIQCTYPLLATAPWMFIAFTIVAILHWLYVKNGSAEEIQAQGSAILMIGTFLFVCLIYFGLVYKYFIISTVCMCVTITPCSLIFIGVLRNHGSLFDHYGLCVAISYVLIIAGTVISWYLSKLVYKKDMSKAAFKMMMKKA